MMARDAARQPAVALVETVLALYEDLTEVTTAFLEVIQDGVPPEEAQALFWQVRTDLIGRVQPLLAEQKEWLDHDDEHWQQALAVQVKKMERLAALDSQVISRLAALQAVVGEELKSLAQGKKGLVGYRVGLKGSPRFCQRTA